MQSSNELPVSLPQAPLEGKVSFTGAGKTIDSEGNKVTEGGRTWRIELVKGDNRFNLEVLPKSEDTLQRSNSEVSSPIFIRAKNVGKEADTSEYVLVKFSGGDSYYVLLSDLENRLHLTEGEIRQAAAEGKLEALMQNTINILPKAIDFFQSTKKAYFKQRDQELVTKGLKKDAPPAPTGLSPKELVLIAKAAAQGLSHYVVRPETSSNPLEVGIKVKDGKLRIYSVLEDTKPLGQGTFNVVYKRNALHKAASKAMKLPREDKGPQAIKDAENQAHILNMVNLEGGHVAIEKPPTVIVPLGETTKRYLYTLHMKDLTVDEETVDEYPPLLLEPPQVLQNMKDLVSGLAMLQRLGIIHGDLKSENLFFTFKGHKFIIGDFGGSTVVKRNLDPNDPGEPLNLGTFTAENTPFSELKAAGEMVLIHNFVRELKIAYQKNEELQLDDQAIQNVKISVDSEIKRCEEERAYFTNESVNQERVAVLNKRIELYSKLKDEINDLESNKGHFDPSKLNAARNELYTQLRDVALDTYAERRYQLEVFNMGVILCEMTSPLLTPLYNPTSLDSDDEVDQARFFQTSSYVENTQPLPHLLGSIIPRSPVLDPDRYSFDDIYSFITESWPPAVADAIQRMVSPIPYARPTPAESSTIWENIRLEE